MEIKFNPTLDEKGEVKKAERIKAAEIKKALKEYQPSMQELWFTGYETHTGKVKPGIYQTKLSDSDRNKLEAVYQAIQNGELPVGVDDMKKFTKSHALRLYPVLIEKNRQKMIDRMINNRPDNYILVQDLKALFKMLEKLDRERIIAIDTETTGLNLHGVGDDPIAKIVGFVITLPSYDLHYYIPFGHTTGEKQLPEHVVIEALRPFIENPELKKVFHNAKYDIHVMKNHGLTLRGFHFDTMVGMSLLNENEMSFALKNLANRYGKFFGYEDSSATYEELFGKGGFEGTPLDIGSIYAAKDGQLTWLFYQFIMDQFDKLPEIKKYYFEVEQEITEVSVEMEHNGFEVDFAYATKYAKELERDLEMLESELKRHFGDINVNSPSQLSEVLYDKLKLPDVSKKRSTDANTLKKLAKENKGCEILLQYRDLNKLLSTYIKPLPEKVGRDGRLHGQFKQSMTVTGRFSSSDPNLQNLPKKARKIIQAAEGKLIIGIDFSQIEPRVLAHMSGCPKFSEPYLTGRDLYSEIASNVFNVPIEECGDQSDYRSKAKVILLAVMYGMMPQSLAEMLKISILEATKFIEDFFAAYPDVTAFMEELNRQADTVGFVTMMYGRKRRFIGHIPVAKAYHELADKLEKKYGFVPADIWGSKMSRDDKMKLWQYAKPYGAVKRQSVNATIQGSAAIIMKIAMNKLYRHCLKMGYKFLATVHDEVLIEVPDNISRQDLEALAAVMADAVTLDVPVKVDVEVSQRWGAGMGMDDWFELQETGSLTRTSKKGTEIYSLELRDWVSA